MSANKTGREIEEIIDRLDLKPIRRHIDCPYCGTDITNIGDEIKTCPSCLRVSTWSSLSYYDSEFFNEGEN